MARALAGRATFDERTALLRSQRLQSRARQGADSGNHPPGGNLRVARAAPLRSREQASSGNSGVRSRIQRHLLKGIFRVAWSAPLQSRLCKTRGLGVLLQNGRREHACHGRMWRGHSRLRRRDCSPRSDSFDAASKGRSAVFIWRESRAAASLAVGAPRPLQTDSPRNAPMPDVHVELDVL